VQRQVWTAAALGSALGLAAAFARFVPRLEVSRTGLIAALILGLVVAITIGVPPLTVEAYPDTYRQSSVAYDATSIAAGRRLYLTHCVSCHGTDATGNGPLARALPKPPADLTAPHAGEHTPGDLYWWLTHGMRDGRMPGFADRTTSDERWDVINYLHTLSRGYQARIIQSRAVPGRPWLGAPLFNYTGRDNTSGTLREFRERSAVLLVLFSWPQSRERMAALANVHDAIGAEGASVLAVPMRPLATDSLMQLPASLTVVGDGSEEIAASYALFRRTLDNARTGESGPIPSHLEFLIDRYGYLRARWIPDDSPLGWSNEAQLLEQLRLLKAEPRIKPPPDDHLH
jgi:putative copper resistance protein D